MMLNLSKNVKPNKKAEDYAKNDKILNEYKEKCKQKQIAEKKQKILEQNIKKQKEARELEKQNTFEIKTKINVDFAESDE